MNETDITGLENKGNGTVPETDFPCVIEATQHAIVEMRRDPISDENLEILFTSGERRVNNRGPGYIYGYGIIECIAVPQPCHYFVITAYKKKSRGKKGRGSGGHEPGDKRRRMNMKVKKRKVDSRKGRFTGKCFMCDAGEFEFTKHPFTVTDETLGDFDAYVCNNCGEAFFTEEARKCIQALLDEKYPDSEVMTAEDVSLILLYSRPEAPMRGAISFMKQAFLFVKEFARKFHIPVEDLDFRPFNYGPYSVAVDESWDVLEEDGAVTKYGRRSTRKETFELTERGYERAKELFDNLSSEARDELRQLRRDWHELGNDGILKLVYREYPEYAAHSKIKDQVLPGLHGDKLHKRA